ncbi:DUF1176 domain-containing protein [Methylobrevis albus]|uniref:DUF1176 domain-containing protein n=1 Tax=Methylobrevis albus TaxID=2793297 RepID=A0A931MZV0_9HYPH|nr:DUF1176 domain-containing protein [Methylobrevis albus]MBH0238479.1 DUF1176 domain-containing protein [Methylobrevis albus]
MGHALRSALAAALAALLGVVIGALPAAAAETVRFGNVTAVCEDDGSCAALLPSTERRAAADGREQPVAVFQLQRAPGSRARWTMSFTTLADLADRDRTIAMAVDGGVGVTLRAEADYAPFVRPDSFYILSAAGRDRMMIDLQSGATLRIRYIDIAGAPREPRFALDGLTAALAHIDRAQNRIAGDRRTGPPEDLPRAPAVDVPAMIAAAGVPAELVARHGATECEAIDSPRLSAIEPLIGPLSDTATLYVLPCYARDGGRVAARLWLIESGEIGGIHPLYFADYSSRFGWTGTEVLENVAYDEGARVLTATMPGTSDGCGRTGRWRWDAYAFKLERFAVWEDCIRPRAAATWPVVYEGR